MSFDVYVFGFYLVLLGFWFGWFIVRYCSVWVYARFTLFYWIAYKLLCLLGIVVLWFVCCLVWLICVELVPIDCLLFLGLHGFCLGFVVEFFVTLCINDC